MSVFLFYMYCTYICTFE